MTFFLGQSPHTNLCITHSHFWLSNHWFKIIRPKGSSAFTKDFWDPTMKSENSLNSSLSMILPSSIRKGNPNSPQRNTQHFFHSSCVPAPSIPLFQHSLWRDKERRENEEEIPKYRSDDLWEVPGLALRTSHDLCRCSRCSVPTSSLPTSCCFHFQPWQSFIPSPLNPNNPLSSPHSLLQ